MTNIDEATGLPELPEGYFWRKVLWGLPAEEVGVVMSERVVATSHTAKVPGRYYRVDTERVVTHGWMVLHSDFKDIGSAVAYAKAFGGARWRVVEVTPEEK